MSTYPPPSQPISAAQRPVQQQQGPYSQSPTSQPPYPSPYAYPPPQLQHPAVADIRNGQQGYFAPPPPGQPPAFPPAQHQMRPSNQSLNQPGSSYAQGYPSPTQGSPRQAAFGPQGYPSPGQGQPSPGPTSVPQYAPLPPQGYPPSNSYPRRQSLPSGASYEYQTQDGQLAPYSTSPSGRQFLPSPYDQNYGGSYPPHQRPRMDSQGSHTSHHSHHSHHSHRPRRDYDEDSYDDGEYNDDRRHSDRPEFPRNSRSYSNRDEYSGRRPSNERRWSHDSQYNGHSHHEHERRRKESEKRPTLGDSMILMWDTVKGAVTGKRD